MADMNVGFGKKSNVLLTGFKAGLKKESLKTEQEKSVFDAIDKDKNGVLDENEVQNFTKALDASNDGKVSRKEAKAFLKENNLDLKKKEVLNFLKANINNTENVESAKSVQQDGKTVVQVTYKDGSVETINPDKSSELATTDADGNVKTQYKDENGVLTKDRLEKKDGDKTVSTLETDYAQDGKTPTQSVEQDLENNSTTTILYKSGTPESKKLSKAQQQAIILITQTVLMFWSLKSKTKVFLQKKKNKIYIQRRWYNYRKYHRTWVKARNYQKNF